MDGLFQFHRLNDQGIDRARRIAHAFDKLLDEMKGVVIETNNREFSLAKTHLEEACFYTKKAMAMQPSNQEVKDE